MNIREIFSSKARLRRIINNHRPLVVALLESFLAINKNKWWAHFLHLPNFCHNIDVRGKVWLFWADSITFHLVSATTQALTGWFSYEGSRFLSTFVYATCFQLQRRALWKDLCYIAVFGCPWFIGRDFNIIHYRTERLGGSFGSDRAI